jgi:hypothetical protein
VSAAEASRKDVKDVRLLFVQNAKDVVVKDGRLTLVGASPTTLRPGVLVYRLHRNKLAAGGYITPAEYKTKKEAILRA